MIPRGGEHTEDEKEIKDLYHGDDTPRSKVGTWVQARSIQT